MRENILNKYLFIPISNILLKFSKRKKIDDKTIISLSLFLIILNYILCLLIDNIFIKIIFIVSIIICYSLNETYYEMSANSKKELLIYDATNLLDVYIFYSVIGIFAFNEIAFPESFHFLYLILGSLTGFLLIYICYITKIDNKKLNAKKLSYTKRKIIDILSPNDFALILLIVALFTKTCEILIIIYFLFILFIIINILIDSIREK